MKLPEAKNINIDLDYMLSIDLVTLTNNFDELGN